MQVGRSEGESNADTPKVLFISYSHDSEEHRERVLGLSERLRQDGYETRLDRYVSGTPEEGWPRWMLNRLDEADFVLMICTETYYRRFRGHEQPDRGKGADWEGALITQEIYDARSQGLKFVPVLFERADSGFIPEPLRRQTHYVLDSRAAYASLCDFLDGVAGVEPGPVGARGPRSRPRGKPLTFGDEPRQVHQPPEAPLAPRWTDELKTYGDGFAGREEELAALDEAWGGGRTRVFSLYAEGGAGKTRVLVRWLNKLCDDGWPGAGGVFVHSFYSQGSDERRNASSEEFFGQALVYFGYEGDPITDASEKGRKLAELVLAQQGLLVLDGLEPLQHSPAFSQGRLKDPGIERLLLTLSVATGDGAGPALCIVASRQPVVELKSREGKAVVQRHLDRLDPAAGVELLRQLEVRGPDRELRHAVEDFDGHAYSLMLLGSYLRNATTDHEIRRHHETRFMEEDREHGRHARRMFGAYVQHLGEDSAEVAVLRLLGFFDRAAERELLDALRAPQGVIYEVPDEAKKEGQLRQLLQRLGGSADQLPALPQPERKTIDDSLAVITGPLIDLPAEDWERVLGRLRDLRLIAFDSGQSTIDSHPLLREEFADQVREHFPDAWRAGHRRLYEHLCETTENQPDTLEGLAPLYQAVAHGCQAGLHQQACDGVYWARIQRGQTAYSTRQLGAIGADLGAIACFFERPWSRLSPNLSAPDQAWLLNEAAFSLRALGRLAEAAEPMRVTLDINVKAEQWKNAAVAAGNLSELELTLGEVSAAVADAKQSVTFADRSGEEFQRMGKRTTHADALHQAGRRDEARQLFAEAEALQAERQPEYPRHYSVQGFQYCDVLLSGAERAAWQQVQRPAVRGQKSAVRDQRTDIRGQRSELRKVCREVEERAKEALEWESGMAGAPILDFALNYLTLGRAGLYEAILTGSPIGERQPVCVQTRTGRSDIDSAVDGLRKAGQVQEFPRGLLTRAWQRQLAGDWVGAAADLAEAWEIAERGSMRLYLADVLLTRARLFGLNIEDCQLKIGDGRERSEAGGYPWGSPEEDLAEARRLIEKCGYHRRDEELADAEAALKGR